MIREKPRIPFGSPLYLLFEYGLVVLGSFIVALSFNLFLNPNRIAAGGVSGISTILYAYFGWEPAIVQWTLNVPLYISGVLLIGRKFGAKTAVGSLIFPFFVWLTRDWQPMTDQMLLAAVFGGIGIGVGLGLVFRGRGSTGGLDIASQIMCRYTGLSYALSVAILDGLVIIAAGIAFSAEQAMYALIGLFATSKTIDVVQIGFSQSKVAFIISDHPDEIGRAILTELDRGLTRLTGYGGYTGTPKEVLLVVVGQAEVTKMKAIVRQRDPNAFIILSDTTEVLGEGFKRTH